MRQNNLPLFCVKARISAIYIKNRGYKKNVFFRLLNTKITNKIVKKRLCFYINDGAYDDSHSCFSCVCECFIAKHFRNLSYFCEQVIYIKVFARILQLFILQLGQTCNILLGVFSNIIQEVFIWIQYMFIHKII